eukprot:3490897-Amphidinium_carterae.1
MTFDCSSHGVILMRPQAHNPLRMSLVLAAQYQDTAEDPNWEISATIVTRNGHQLFPMCNSLSGKNNFFQFVLGVSAVCKIVCSFTEPGKGNVVCFFCSDALKPSSVRTNQERTPLAPRSSSSNKLPYENQERQSSLE